MPPLFHRLREIFAPPFGDLTPDEQRSLAIERLSDPQANLDEIARGLQALGERRTIEDIDRLVALSSDNRKPDYWHQWIAEALLYVPSSADAAVQLLCQLSAAMQDQLAPMLCVTNPEWAPKIDAFMRNR